MEVIRPLIGVDDGDDLLWGGAGNDALYGGNSSDHLDGGPDTDTCTRGDTITGYDLGEILGQRLSDQTLAILKNCEPEKFVPTTSYEKVLNALVKHKLFSYVGQGMNFDVIVYQTSENPDSYQVDITRVWR